MPYLSKLVKRITLGWCLLASATACGVPDAETATEPEAPAPATPNVASVRVTPDSVEAVKGSRLRITAEPRDDRGQLLLSEHVVWTSSNPTIATVDSTGEVTMLNTGSAEVTATVRGRWGKGRLTVRQAPVASVAVSPSSANLITGQTVALAATLSSATGEVLTGRAITWTSLSPAVASVSASGVVTGLAAGSAQIVASSEGVSGVAAVAVAPPPPGAPGTVGTLATVSATDSSVTLRFTEVADGASAPANYELRYSASSFDWATAIGVVRGSCSAPIAGTSVGAVRTCEVRGLSAETQYRFAVRAFRGTFGSGAAYGAVSNIVTGTTAQAPIASIAVAPGSASRVVGQTASFTATLRDAAGNVLTGRTITWSSSATGIATVNASGVATAVAPGSTSIRATAGGITSSASLTVTAPVPAPAASVTVAPGTSALTTGQTASFTATVRDSAGNVLTGRTIAWSSSNTAIATVSSSGTATAVAAGSASIRATVEGVTGSAALTVSAPAPAPAASVTVAPGTSALTTGQTATFAATVRDASGNVLTGRSISWSSSSAAIATVTSSGVATAVAAGSASIRATVEGVTGSASLTVTAPAPPPPTGEPVPLVFSSEWTSSTGNTQSAVTDGGKWNGLACSNYHQTLAVVPGSSVGFNRSANVLRIQDLGSSICGMLEQSAAVPASTTHWGRMYFRNDIAASGTHNHVGTYNAIGNIQVTWWSRQGTTANGFYPFLRMYYQGNGSPTAYPYNRWAPRQPLANNTWYRYEWHMEFLSPTVYRLWPRVYDMAGNLILDADDFLQSDPPSSGGHSLASYYAAGNSFGYSDATLSRRLGLGNEGPPSSVNSGQYWYHARVGLSTTGWIGQ